MKHLNKLNNLKSVLLTALTLIFIFMQNEKAAAQCGGGFSQAYLNWDWQYVNSTGYVLGSTGTRFCIGTNSVKLTSTGTVTSNSEDGTHSGNGGVSINNALDPTQNNDADLTTGNGTLVLTFNADVSSLNFTLYDLDLDQAATITAVNGSAVAQNVSLTALGTSTLTLSGSGTTSASATGGSGAVAQTSNNAAVTVTISGPVKTITITFTKTSGSDNVWLSDIQACVAGNYATNYQAVNTPEAGEVEYFLFASDSAVNVVNATTGAATLLFVDPSFADINSLAYDPYHSIVYYTDDEYVLGTNKAIYKYNVKTGVISTFISDVTASPYNLVISDEGMGSGGATFYNGSLFIGVETTTNGDAASAYRIDFAGDGVTPTMASQLNAQQGADGGGPLFGYGDFVANDGTFYISNAAITNLEIFDLNSQILTDTFGGYHEQLSISANGTPRYVTNTPDFAAYAGGGTWGSPVAITGSVGTQTNDATEVYKFPSDYGDAPATYGVPYHGYVIPHASVNLRLGSDLSYEVNAQPSTAANLDGFDDGVSSIPALTTADVSYSMTISVYNNTGGNTNLSGWVDFNKNGVFDAGEKQTSVVSTSGSAQNIVLTWTGIGGTIVGGRIYARFRIATTGSEVASPNTKAADGEVEDYPIDVAAGIIGTIWDDADGGLTINGAEAGTNASSSVIAYLIFGGVVIDSAQVSANGTYGLKANPNTTYTVMISTTSVAIGAATPSITVPSNYDKTGINFQGTPTSNVLTGTVVVGTVQVPNINFGIEQKPNSDPYSFTIPGNAPINSAVTLTAGNYLGPLSGSDPEDGTYGTGATYTIASLAGMNGNELYYDADGDAILTAGELLAVSSTITSYDPNKMYIKFITAGSTTSSFTYYTTDAAGRIDPTPATYTASWTTPLPIEVLSFDGFAHGSEGYLYWNTASEVNSSYFVLEQSSDLRNWSNLATVSAQGFSTKVSNYSVIDPKLDNGNNYYRLKEVDLDGSFRYYFKTLNLTSSGESSTINVNLYPNPTTGSININLISNTEADVKIEIYDMTGRLVFSDLVNSAIGSNIINESIEQMPAGAYLLKVSTDEQVVLKNIIKQ